MDAQPKNPLHGVTLAMLVEQLVAKLGWERMAAEVPIPCFVTAPTIVSSLKYLRRYPEARALVEELYLRAVVDGSSSP